jgi:hypothetical protein
MYLAIAAPRARGPSVWMFSVVPAEFGYLVNWHRNSAATNTDKVAVVAAAEKFLAFLIGGVGQARA